MNEFQWILFFLSIQIIHFLGTWKLYKTAGEDPWKAIVPVYNAIIFLKILHNYHEIFMNYRNDNKIVFYKILLETEKSYFQSKDKIYKLVPGVEVVASIHIGQRTVANYLFAPFVGSMGQSFQER